MAFLSTSFPQCCSSQVSRVLILFKHATYKPNKLGLFISNVCDRPQVASTDPLDNFTSKLVQEKKEKWKNMTMKVVSDSETRADNYQKHNEKLAKFDIDSIAINELMRKAVDLKDLRVITSLLNVCKTKNFYPSTSLLAEAASIFSREGNKAGIHAVQSVCKKHSSNDYLDQGEFKHFIAEATWINGNVEEALELFMEAYRYHPPLRRKIRNMTKYLYAECVANKSEASVVLVTRYAKKYATKYGDYYFLAFLWHSLFLSEWFGDQKIANDLIEEYSELRTLVEKKLQIIASVALIQKQIEIVQRLIEIALKYDMKRQYTYILRSFFDYKCSQCDLKGCIEILASASEMNVALTKEQHDRFINLLLENQHRHVWLSKRKLIKPSQKELPVPPFQMKF